MRIFLLVTLLILGQTMAWAEEYVTYLPQDVFKNQTELKGKIFIMANTGRELKTLPSGQVRIAWSQGEVNTEVDAKRAEAIQYSRTLYTTVTEPGAKAVMIQVMGNTLVDGKVSWQP